MTKVTIGIPVYGGIQPKTTESLLNLIAKSNYEFHIVMAEDGYTIAENRNYIVVQALNNKSDYLLMVDADMVFPPDTLDKLIADNKEICGVAYHARGGKKLKCVESEIMSIAEVSKKEYINLDTNTDPKYKNTFECYATGTGIILIKCEIFYKIPRPWFKFEWYDTGQCKEGEDWVFCKKAKEQGYKIFTNPTIEVGHLGEVIMC